MHSRTLLALCTATIVVIWQFPYGHQVLYPLTLLATYAHEMGHGLKALLTGAEFEQLVLHADGSGQATWRGDPGRLTGAAIAAGGLRKGVMTNLLQSREKPPAQRSYLKTRSDK